jgi:hypothetical protein
VTATVAPGISPGNSEPVTFAAANTSNSGIHVSNVSLVSITATGGLGTCTTADFSMADVPQNVEVLANATAQTLAPGSLVYADTTSNQDGCQGATLTLTLATS